MAQLQFDDLDLALDDDRKLVSRLLLAKEDGSSGMPRQAQRLGEGPYLIIGQRSKQRGLA